MSDRDFDVRNGGSAFPWRQLQGLIGDAARVQARWAKAVVTTAQAAGRGEVPSPGELVKSIAGEYRRYVRDVAALNLEYARAVQQLAAASGERFSEVVEDATPPERRVVDFPMPAESATVASPPTKRATSRRARGAATGTTAVQKAATRKAAARKTAARKAATKKSAARNAATKKAATKKAAAKKAATKAPARARRTPPAPG